MPTRLHQQHPLDRRRDREDFTLHPVNDALGSRGTILLALNLETRASHLILFYLQNFKTIQMIRTTTSRARSRRIWNAALRSDRLGA